MEEEKRISKQLTHIERYKLYKFIRKNGHLVEDGLTIQDFAKVCSDFMNKPINRNLVGQICMAFNIQKHRQDIKPIEENSFFDKLLSWFR